jgi:hypothetical protein
MCCALELTLVDKDAVASFQFWSHCGNSMVEELKKVKGKLEQCEQNALPDFWQDCQLCLLHSYTNTA